VRPRDATVAFCKEVAAVHELARGAAKVVKPLTLVGAQLRARNWAYSKPKRALRSAMN